MKDERTTLDARPWIDSLAIGLLVFVAVHVANALHRAHHEEHRQERLSAIASEIATSIGDPGEITSDRAAESSRLTGTSIRFRGPDKTIDADGARSASPRLKGLAIPGAPGWRVEAWSPPISNQWPWLPWTCGGIATVLVGIAQSRRRSELVRLRREIVDLESIGRIGDIEGAAEHLSMPSNRPMQSIVQPFKDLLATWAKRIEELEALRHQSELVVDSIASGVIVIGPDNSIEYINPVARRLFEFPPEKAEALETLDLSEAVREPDIHDMVAEVASSGRTLRRTFLASRSTGDRQLELSTAVAPILDPRSGESDPRPAGTVVLIEDATDLRRLERARSEFVGNVSHELRTPLTNLLGYLSTAREMDADEPRKDEFLGVAQSNAERLASIIEDLLALARLEDSGSDLECDPIRLESLLERVADHHRASLDFDSGKLKVTCPPDLELMGSASLLEQAVDNLTTNALRYGGAEGEVRIEGRRRGDAVEILVSDEGPGISPRHADRIFERFYRVDTARSRATGGTGLGLAIVKHIAVAHGGQVKLESRLGNGSTFQLTIPCRTEPTGPNSDPRDPPDRRFPTEDSDTIPIRKESVPSHDLNQAPDEAE